MSTTHHQQMVEFFLGLQDRICTALEAADGGAKFHEDHWERPGGGGGRTRVISEGNVFEKGGVNFSEVFGEMSPEFAKQLPGEGTRFSATGVSLVIHPRNPHVPTVHANFRFLTKGESWWFGGGADLTPFYPVLEDVVHFHKVWKRVCEKYSPLIDYKKFKNECDQYFYLPHRKEARGVGGIFFDYLQGDFDRLATFVKDCADQFNSSYIPIVERRKNSPYTEQEKKFQEYRRGRYVEFNLLYDRGTVFGLKTDGRVESILMSLPPTVRYWYDYRPEPNSKEEQLTHYWLLPKDWAEMG